jgi:hypothetical protein
MAARVEGVVDQLAGNVLGVDPRDLIIFKKFRSISGTQRFC